MVAIPGRLVEKLRNARAMKSQWGEVESEARAEIEQIMGDDAIATYRGQTVVKWETVKSRRFNQAAFKKAHPDLYELFLETSETRPFKPVD